MFFRTLVHTKKGHRLWRAFAGGRLLLHRGDHGRQRQSAPLRQAEVHREREAGHQHWDEHPARVRQR